MLLRITTPRPNNFYEAFQCDGRVVLKFHDKQELRLRNASAVGTVQFLHDEGISYFLLKDREFNPVNVKNYQEVDYVVRKCCIFCLANG